MAAFRKECCRVASIAENLELVQSRIAAAAEKSSRAAADIEMIGVSKKQDAEKIRAAFDSGQAVFGESRVQEARVKMPLLPAAVRWQFIGHLQKNKVRHALPLFEFFHSVDSLALAVEIDRIAGEEGVRPRVLLEVNLANEASKIGFAPASLRAEMEQILALRRLDIEGLMTIPPMAAVAEDSRTYFVTLRQLRDALQDEFDVRLSRLSMGMSNDYEIAIEEGATLVRVGTAIFGTRGDR